MIIAFGGYLVCKGSRPVGAVDRVSGLHVALARARDANLSSISETQRGPGGMERVFDVLEKPGEAGSPARSLLRSGEESLRGPVSFFVPVPTCRCAH